MEAAIRTENPSILGRPECLLPIQGVCECCRERPAQARHHIIAKSLIKQLYRGLEAVEKLKDLNNLMLVCNICHAEIDRVPKKPFKKRKKISKKHGHVPQLEEGFASNENARGSIPLVPAFFFLGE